jgi:predicted nucleotidyltransferase
MESFGEKIRKIRVERKLTLRKIAAYLDIDQAILSKIERGIRKANREHVIKLEEFFNLQKNELLIIWVSDQLVYQLLDEEIATEALQVAEQKLAYQKKSISSKAIIIKKIRNILKTDGRIKAAWLFGSYARDEQNFDSDVDLIVEMKPDKNYSLFDLMDIAHLLENETNIKIDLVEKGSLKGFARKTAQSDMIKIYG